MKYRPLIERFRDWTGNDPSFLVRAPGRVNLIGEHTDYNGYPVLPISIPHSILAVVSARAGRTVSIRNIQPVFQDCEFALAHDIPRAQPGDWSNYVRAAASRLAKRYGALRGADILFGGTIPPSAGLSSSSALVIAAALALLTANGISADPVDLAGMMAEGEQYVGTEGGGMDQAACLLGSEHHATRIDFFPLRHTYIPFPSECSVIVAHSLVRAAKTENALLEYNRRPLECRLAVTIINRILRIDSPLQRLGDIPRSGILNHFESVESFIGRIFPRNPSLDEIAACLGKRPERILRDYLTTRTGLTIPEPSGGFRLPDRVRHVLTEAERVEEGCGMLRCGDAGGFGRLMNESHRSCDEQYGISTPEVNTLTEIMRNAGALGARITGAGFGGCAIALVRDTDADRVLKAVRGEYYERYLGRTSPDNMFFTVKPAGGAEVRPTN